MTNERAQSIDDLLPLRQHTREPLDRLVQYTKRAGVGVLLYGSLTGLYSTAASYTAEKSRVESAHEFSDQSFYAKTPAKSDYMQSGPRYTLQFAVKNQADKGELYPGLDFSRSYFS